MSKQSRPRPIFCNLICISLVGPGHLGPATDHLRNGLPLIPQVMVASEMQRSYLILSSGKNELVSVVTQPLIAKWTVDRVCLLGNNIQKLAIDVTGVNMNSRLLVRVYSG